MHSVLRHSRLVLQLLCAAWVISVPVAHAQQLSQSSTIHDDHEFIEEITVWGSSESQKGSAISASEGLAGFADFSTRPLSRVGELVEVIPGMVATQHSGEGKANQYFLRGMNLDHGTDFSAFIEGMPVNLRSHAHGQGYLDLNFLIPELVSTVQFRRGPYYADAQDFSTAGSSEFSIYDHLENGFVELSAGSDDYYRLVAADSFDIEDDHLVLGLELLRSNGPWTLKSKVKKINALAKYKAHREVANVSVLASAYANEWNSTDQIPARAVPDIGRFGFIDPSLGGKSHRVSLITNIDSTNWEAGAYLSNYELHLFQNPTYFLEDSVNGDAIEQHDARWVMGLHAQTSRTTDIHTWRMGTDLRYDAVSNADLSAIANRARRENLLDTRLDELSLGVFLQIESQWNPQLRSTLGTRAYHYRFDVTAKNNLNSGKDNDSIILPKLMLAYAPNTDWEFYLNYGQGFHSNDVRGVTASNSSVEALVRQHGAEFGMRYESSRVNISLVGFWLKSESELIFVGDAGISVPSDGTHRLGAELDVFWQPTGNVTIDLNAAKVRSRFSGFPSGEGFVPNTHGFVLGAGVTYVSESGVTASVRARHFGDAPLIENNSIAHKDTTLVNLGMSYDFHRFSLSLDIFNLFDTKADDIAFFFESRLQDEEIPVEDLHFHPVEPVSVRFSIRMDI